LFRRSRRETKIKYEEKLNEALKLASDGQAYEGKLKEARDAAVSLGGRRGGNAMYKISVMIWLLVLLAVGLVILFIKWPGATKQFLGDDPELFKLTYQFLLLTVIGGGVALFFKHLDRLRAMRQSLREMHAELLEAFNQAKSVRRHLRAQLGTVVAVHPDTKITVELYDDQMESLSDAQLIFEVHAKRAKDSSLWFWGKPGLSQPLGKVPSHI